VNRNKQRKTKKTAHAPCPFNRRYRRTPSSGDVAR